MVLSPYKNASSLITKQWICGHNLVQLVYVFCEEQTQEFILDKKFKILRYGSRTYKYFPFICHNKFLKYPFVKVICFTLCTYYSNEHKAYAYEVWKQLEANYNTNNNQILVTSILLLRNESRFGLKMLTENSFSFLLHNKII